MKHVMLLLVCSSVFSAACAQESGNAQATQKALEKSIQRFVFEGYSEGQDIKQIRRGGDASAVTLTKILADHVLNNVQIEDALYILNAAFADTGLIEDASERTPKTGLFVLRYLDLCTQEPALKAKILETREHLASVAGQVPHLK